MIFINLGPRHEYGGLGRCYWVKECNNCPLTRLRLTGNITVNSDPVSQEAMCFGEHEHRELMHPRLGCLMRRYSILLEDARDFAAQTVNI